MEKKHKVLVYVGRIPNSIEFSEIYPKSRSDEIAKCKNLRVKREKYFVWELLRRGAEEGFGMSLEELAPRKNENGKWVSDKLCFSITHSYPVAAVAMSLETVGIDAESVDRYFEGMEKRILTDREVEKVTRLSGEALERYTLEKWTQKESIFKTTDLESFLPKTIETEEYPTQTVSFSIDGEEFVLSVTAKNIDKIEYFYDFEKG